MCKKVYKISKNILKKEFFDWFLSVIGFGTVY